MFYRSPCSTAENDLNLFALISSLCTAKVGNLLCLGDFNWPNIDWSTWTPSSNSGSEFQFIDTLRKNFLNQYVSIPTRARGDDHPHILDLVLTNESFIENIVDRRIRWHYTTTILRLRIGARLTRYRNCKFHNFARTISRHADGIRQYSVPPITGPATFTPEYSYVSPSRKK